MKTVGDITRTSHLEWHRRWWCPVNTFDYPVSDHRRGVKVVSCQRGGSNPRRHQLLLYRPTSEPLSQTKPTNTHGKPRLKRGGVDCPTQPTPLITQSQTTVLTIKYQPTPTHGKPEVAWLGVCLFVCLFRNFWSTNICCKPLNNRTKSR